jgi:hypothetical protein
MAITRKRAAVAVISALLALWLALGWTAPAEAAPATPDTPASVDAPRHTPWPNFTFDVCQFTKISKMNLPNSTWFVHTSDIQTAHFGGHFVYCAARRFGASNAENSVCWLIHWEQDRLVDSWTAPRFQCN